MEEPMTDAQAHELIRSYGVHGTDEQIDNLNRACDRVAATLEAAAIALRDLKNGNAAELDSPDVLEAMLTRLIQSGQPRLAMKLYHERYHFRKVGIGYATLGRKRGHFQHGLKLTSLFKVSLPESQNRTDAINDPEVGLPDIEHDRALFLIELGELADAESILRSPTVSQVDGYYPGVEGKSLYQFAARLNLCDALILEGKLSEANHIADVMIGAYESDDVEGPYGYPQSERLYHRARIGEYVGTYRFTTGFNPYARRALTRALQGQINGALADFKQAEDFQQRKLDKLYSTQALLSQVVYYSKTGLKPPQGLFEEIEARQKILPLSGQAVIFYAMLLTRLGKLHTAQKILDYGRRWAAHSDNHFPGMVAFADVALSDVYRLMGDYDASLRQLEHSLAWSAETGQKEIACWSHQSLARLYLARRELDQAQSVLNEALSMTVKHRFILYEIDCRITAGRIAFLNQDWKAAQENVIKALHDAADPDCRYAWAHGSALHLLAEIYAHPSYLPDYVPRDRKHALEDAERLARGAIRIRERIQDPRLANSHELLAKIATEGA